MKARRIVIAAVLFVAGTAVYLTQSGAPLRVHIVTVPTELALAVVATYFLSATSLSPRTRIIGVTVGLICVSVLTTWLSSKVIAALMPLDPWYFVMDLAATFIKATVLIGVVWLIDFGIDLVQGRWRGRNESLMALFVLPLLFGLSGCVTMATIGDEQPQVISRTEPTYPAELRERRVEGLVKVEATIGIDGIPRNIRVVHDDPNIPATDPALEKLTIETLSTWRFKPAVVNGKPVERRFVTSIHWKAQ